MKLLQDRLNDVIVTFLLDDIPSYIHTDYPNLYNFLDDYYNYLKKDDRLLDILSNYHRNLNIATADEEYLDQYLLNMGFEYIDKIIDKRQFALFLLEFYASAGSLESYQYLFRSLFDEDVRIEFPREQLMIPSYADYYQTYYMYTSSNNIYSEDFEYIKSMVKNTPIRAFGLTSKLEALIESIDIVYTLDESYLKIGLFPPQFEFNVNEVVEFSLNDISFKEYVKPVLNINVKNKGNLYNINDNIQITGSGIVGRASIEKLSKGIIKDLRINNPNMINPNDIIRSSDVTGTGFGFVAQVTKDKRLTIFNNGYDYIRKPSFLLNDVIVESDVLEPILEDVGGIQSIKIDSPFVDYDPNDIEVIINTKDGYGFDYNIVQSTLHIERGYRSYEGTLNRNSYLTDSYKYQQFSYLIISSALPSEYIDIVKKFLHPSGYIFFPILEIYRSIDLDLFNSADSATIKDIESTYIHIDILLEYMILCNIVVNNYTEHNYSVMIQSYKTLLDYMKFNELFNHPIIDYINEDMTLYQLYETNEYENKSFRHSDSALVEVING